MAPWIQVALAVLGGGLVALGVTAAQDYVRRRRALLMLRADIRQVLRDVEEIWGNAHPRIAARMAVTTDALMLLSGRFEDSSEWFTAALNTPALESAMDFYRGVKLTRGAAAVWRRDMRLSGDWAAEAHKALGEMVAGVTSGGPESLKQVEEALEQLRPLDWLSEAI